MARYIDADKAVEELRLLYCSRCDSYDGMRCRTCHVDDIASYLDGYPEADVVEVKHGKWIDKVYFGIEVPTCSVCGYESKDYEYHDYCYCCHAKMKWDGNDEE